MSENLGNLGIPNPQLPIGSVPDGKGGSSSVRLDNIWYRFLTRLGQLSAEKSIVALTVGASPWSWTADTIGHVNIIGGTVSLKTLTRGTTTNVTGAQLIPVAAGDVVTVTYSVAPQAAFIPGARA